MLSKSASDDLASRGRPVVWNSAAKYALFVHELAAADADLAEKVAAIDGRPSPEHDMNLSGVVWVDVAHLMDDGWCRKQMHPFAWYQVRAARPVIARLLAGESAADELSAQIGAIAIDDNGPHSTEAPGRSTDTHCASCRYGTMGHGRVDPADGYLYCEACWTEYAGGRWPVIGGSSSRFKELTASMPLCTFGAEQEYTRQRFGEQRIEPLVPGADGASACAELRRTGALNGRLVLGFDTESRPSFRKGQQNPICLVQLATPSIAVLFRLARGAPMPQSLRSLLEDRSVTLVGQDIEKEVAELRGTHRLRDGCALLELSRAARAASCLCAGVATYAAALVGIRLAKSKSLQMSNWEAAALTWPQLCYAATDAWVCWVALKTLESEELLRASRHQRPALFYDAAAPICSATASSAGHAAPIRLDVSEGGDHGSGGDCDRCRSATSTSVGVVLRTRIGDTAPAEAHSTAMGAAAAQPRRIKKCRFFGTAVGCKWGEACKFWHGAEPNVGEKVLLGK
jgi:ribonuclease D